MLYEVTSENIKKIGPLLPKLLKKVAYYFYEIQGRLVNLFLAWTEQVNTL